MDGRVDVLRAVAEGRVTRAAEGGYFAAYLLDGAEIDAAHFGHWPRSG